MVISTLQKKYTFIKKKKNLNTEIDVRRNIFFNLYAVETILQIKTMSLDRKIILCYNYFVITNFVSPLITLSRNDLNNVK